MPKNRYVSILKDKAGELSSIAALSSRVWVEFTPLIEFTPESSAVKQLSKLGSQEVSILCDFTRLASSSEVLNADNSLRGAGVDVIPVLSPAMPESISPDVLACRRFAKESAVRVNLNEVIDPEAFTNWLRKCEVLPQTCHLILDAGYLPEGAKSQAIDLLRQAFLNLPYRKELENGHVRRDCHSQDIRVFCPELERAFTH